MTWVKLADNWNRHRKMVRLSRDARLLWVDGITYSCEQLTDGFIPDEALPLITTGLSGLRKNNVIRELSSAGLWERVEAGSEPSPGQVAAESGWSLHDFLDWNPSRTEVLTRRRLESARKAKSRGYDGCPAGSHATVVPCDSARSPAGSHAAPVPSRHGNEDPDPDHPATATRTAALTPPESGKGRKTRTRSIPTPLDPDWHPNEAHLAIAKELGRNGAWLAMQATKMRDWAAAKGAKANCADWDARFRNWIRDEKAQAGPFPCAVPSDDDTGRAAADRRAAATTQHLAKRDAGGLSPAEQAANAAAIKGMLAGFGRMP
jgi:hypothetical protein